MAFDIENDQDFYCYLKAHLPLEFSIISEPSPYYYSEWSYYYKVFHKDHLYKKYQGDFREVRQGELIREAQDLLKKAIMEANADC